MREYKFRYRIRDRKTEKIIMFTASISEIELRAFSPNPFDWFNYELLSRDLSTDLHDKNGKEIWEGDVVILPGYNQKKQVLFKQGMFCVEEDGSFFPLSQFYSVTEIVGNVFEHPGLLANTQASL